jgi:hypothetical protein
VTRKPDRTPVTFAEAADAIGRLVAGNTRREIIERITGGGPGTGDALARLRAAMRRHTFAAAGGDLTLRREVEALDARTRHEGLHVLHGWDFTAQRRPQDIAPVLLLDYCARAGVPEARLREAVAILLDEYCMALLALLVVRAWDEGAPDENFARVDALAAAVGGPDGSGHRVVDDAGTLLILAVAYYHPEEAAYDALLRRVWTLGERQALATALPCAAVMASHLRWGFRFMYRHDVGRMRADNVVDYPWSLFALVVVMRAWERSREAGEPATARAGLTEALINGLTPDPWAFTRRMPDFFSAYPREHAELREALARHRDALIEECAPLQPSSRAYSPLGFACNFLSNAVVAAATVAVQTGGRHPSLNALLRGEHGEPGPAGAGGDAEAFARRLMVFSSEPARLGAGGAPLIMYDPYDGAHHFNAVLRALRELPGSA